MRKAPKGGALDPIDADINRIIAMVRARVEHPFRVLKRQFGYLKTRYRGLEVDCPTCLREVTIPSVNLSAGDQLSGYRIERLLGAGNMGEVYLATQLSLDRPVALKILPPDLVHSTEGIERFRNEIRILAKVNHPDVVAAFDAGEDKGLYYLAMQYVAGKELGTLVQENGPLNEQDVLKYSWAVADALKTFWNEHGILHRDVKPDNLMLDEDNAVQLLDMGISVNVQENARKTNDGAVIGTPYYMSPEQARGERDIDHRADMYSLGATMFYLLTGRVPFEGGNAQEVFARLAADPVPSVRDFRPEVSEECAELIQHTMAKNRDDRPSTWEEFIEDVKEVSEEGRRKPRPSVAGREDEELQQVPAESWLAQVRAWGRQPVRHQKRAAVITTFLVLIGGVSLGVGAFMLTNEGPEERDYGGSTGKEVVAGEEKKKKREAESERTDTEKEKNRKKIAENLSKIRKYRQKYPQDYGEPIRALKALRKKVQELPGKPYLEKVTSMLAEIKKDRKKAIDEAFESLKQRAQKEFEQNGIRSAIAVYEDYAGPFAEKLGSRMEKEKRRLQEKYREAVESAFEKLQQRAQQKKEAEGLGAAIAEYRGYEGPYADKLQSRIREQLKKLQNAMKEKKQRERERERKRREKLKELRETVARQLFEGNISQAKISVREVESSELFDKREERLETIKRCVKVVQKIHPRICQSLREDAESGETVKLRLAEKDTAVKGKVVKVTAGNTIVIDALIDSSKGGAGTIRKRYALEKLSAKEKIKRLDGPEEPAYAVAKGLLGAWSGHMLAAAHYLRRAQGGSLEKLVNEILSHVEDKSPAIHKKSAQLTWKKLLKKLGEKAGSSKSELIEKVWEKSWPEEEKDKMRNWAQRLRTRYRDTGIVSRYNAVIEAVYDRMKADYERDIEVASAELSERLKQKNEGKAVNLTVKRTDDGRIAVDLSGAEKLENIQPLAGLPMAELNLSRTSVKDLDPLETMPLRKLNLAHTPVEDLGALLGKPLKTLKIHGTSIRDLSVLSPLITLKTVTFPDEAEPKKALKNLDVEKVGVSGDQLMTLEEYGKHLRSQKVKEKETELEEKLKKLRKELQKANRVGLEQQDNNFRFQFEVDADSFWKDEVLVSVDMAYNKGISDIGPLQGMPVTDLDIRQTSVVDLSPLKDVPLKHLKADKTEIRNLYPLKGKALRTLYVKRAPVVNHRIISGMPLKNLSLSGERVKDEGILDGLRLKKLYLHKVGFDDYDFLKDMPLTHLEISWSSFSKLRYLKGKELRSLDIPGAAIDSLRSIKGQPLRTLDIRRTAVDSLAVVEGMPLKHLWISHTQVDDLSPLKRAAELRRLYMSKTLVDDLSPLENMPLRVLWADNMPNLGNKDIKSLAGLPLEKLFLHRSKGVTDVSPLSACKKLKYLTVPRSVERMEGLRELPDLSYIQYDFNWDTRWHQPAKVFWEKWSEGG